MISFKKKNPGIGTIEAFNHLLDLNGLTFDGLVGVAKEKRNTADKEAKALFAQASTIFTDADKKYEMELAAITAQKAQEVKRGNSILELSYTLSDQVSKTNGAIAALGVSTEK